MKSKKNAFVWFYIILVGFDLVCSTHALDNLRLISKPLILLSLLCYFIFQAKSNRGTTFYLMAGALFFSLSGDVFLLFENHNSLYFTLGLASFLLAHLLFVWCFIRKWNNTKDRSFTLVLIALSSYGMLLFYILQENLGTLKIPVILYIIGILAMVITAYRRKGIVAPSSFTLVFLGALFFVLSDSVLAIDKFLFEIPIANIIIMSTYATAQYLITKGVLIQGDFEN